MRIVRLGDRSFIGPDPTPEQRARNAAESEALLRCLKERLPVPGVKIERKPGVPLFYANKYRSGTVIRELDGRKAVGLLAPNGTWRPIDEES